MPVPQDQNSITVTLVPNNRQIHHYKNIIKEKLSSFNGKIDKEGWLARIDDNTCNRQAIKVGLEVVASSGQLLIPICLGNGYYKRSQIKKILRFAASLSERVTIFFTDGPAKHNLFARGKNNIETQKAIKKQISQLRNSCNEAINWINNNEIYKIHPYFIDWESVYIRDDYKAELEYLNDLYLKGGTFRKEVRKSTDDVVVRWMKYEGVKGNQKEIVEIAKDYALEELAFLAIYCNIAGELLGKYKSVERFCYMYYTHWDILEKYAAARYDGIKRPEIGCAVLLVS